jgi:hypothetical protein
MYFDSTTDPFFVIVRRVKQLVDSRIRAVTVR